MSAKWRWKEKRVIGSAELYLGDCRDVIPTLSDVAVVITDPPYSAQVHEGSRTRNDDAPGLLVTFAPISEKDVVEVTSELIKLAQRWVLMTCDWTHAVRFIDAGLPFIRLGVWVKPNSAPQFTGDRPSQGWESVAILHRPGRKHWNGGGSRAVWINNTEPGKHPTQKPLSLVKRWVADFSDQGETVLDPFMGSGTTGVAAVSAGRKFVGIELDPNYFELACQRIEEAQSQTDMFIPHAVEENQKTLWESFAETYRSCIDCGSELPHAIESDVCNECDPAAAGAADSKALNTLGNE